MLNRHPGQGDVATVALYPGQLQENRAGQKAQPEALDFIAAAVS
jgi:hypothetical protein